MRGLISRITSSPSNVEQTAGDLEAHLRRGIEPTWSGMGVTPNSAVNVSTVFACVRAISEDIGKLPFLLYQSGDDRRRAVGSPYYRLVHQRANTWMTTQVFREYMTAIALLRGNAVAIKNEVGGQVRELLPVHPEKVEIKQGQDWEVKYLLPTGSGGKKETFSRRQVVHLMGLSLDGYKGVSIVGLARQGIAFSMAVERHGATFFGNGGHPGGVLKHPKTLGQAAYDRLKESIATEFNGANAHNPLLLEEGMDWSQVGLSNEDSQFLETREFEVEEIARWFRVPLHKVQSMKRATFSNIEHQSLEYVTDTLLAWGLRWENLYNNDVIGTSAVYAELLFDMLLRGDVKTRMEAYEKAITNGIMSRNEARRRENLPPVEGGDRFIIPANMQLLTPEGDVAEKPAPPAPAALPAPEPEKEPASA